MKTTYLLLIAFLLLSVSTHAVEKKMTRDVRTYKTELNLTQNQLTKIDQIRANYNADNPTSTAGKSEAEVRQIIDKRIAMRKEIAKVLTPEQGKALSQIRRVEQEKKVKRVKQ